MHICVPTKQDWALGRGLRLRSLFPADFTVARATVVVIPFPDMAGQRVPQPDPHPAGLLQLLHAVGVPGEDVPNAAVLVEVVVPKEPGAEPLVDVRFGVGLEFVDRWDAVEYPVLWEKSFVVVNMLGLIYTVSCLVLKSRKFFFI